VRAAAKSALRRNRRSSRVLRNKILIPVTLFAVGGGRERLLGVTRGRAEFVKLVKQATPTLAADEHFEVRGDYRALRDIGVSETLMSLRIMTKDRWVEVKARGTTLARNADESPPIAISDWKKVDATLYRWRHPSVTRQDGRDEYRIEKSYNRWIAYYVGRGGERHLVVSRNLGRWHDVDTGIYYKSRDDAPRYGRFGVEKKLEFYTSMWPNLPHEFASAASAAAHAGRVWSST
jgi:hypothetical protein